MTGVLMYRNEHMPATPVPLQHTFPVPFTAALEAVDRVLSQVWATILDRKYMWRSTFPRSISTFDGVEHFLIECYEEKSYRFDYAIFTADDSPWGLVQIIGRSVRDGVAIDIRIGSNAAQKAHKEWSTLSYMPEYPPQMEVLSERIAQGMWTMLRDNLDLPETPVEIVPVMPEMRDSWREYSELLQKGMRPAEIARQKGIETTTVNAEISKARKIHGEILFPKQLTRKAKA